MQQGFGYSAACQPVCRFLTGHAKRGASSRLAPWHCSKMGGGRSAASTLQPRLAAKLQQ